MKSRIAALSLLCLLGSTSVYASEPAVSITQRPGELVHGEYLVPVIARDDVTRVELRINGQRFGEKSGRVIVFRLRIGEYIRRMRVRAVAWSAAGEVLGYDEIVINDPQPPFRVHLNIHSQPPSSGAFELSATVSAPSSLRVTGVDFYVGETRVVTDIEPPWAASLSASDVVGSAYARTVARSATGEEANDIWFWDSGTSEIVDVILKQLPVSVSGNLGGRPLRLGELDLQDDGEQRAIEAIVPAGDQPLDVIILVDSSQSMADTLPMVKQAASSFARTILRPNVRVAIIAFHQHLYWLTPFTSEIARIDQSLEQLRPIGETHLYDAVIQCLFELQKSPGRRALIVLTDGVNQGGSFTLDHLVHYARYSGVPLYPIVRNKWLSRAMKLGIGGMQSKRFAQIARDSGTTYFIVDHPRQLPAVYQGIADELQQQSMVMFYAESSGDDVWHNLKLTTTRPGLVLRIPRGYFP